MAVESATFTTYDAVGNREDLSDVIYRIDPTKARCKADTNTFAMMKRQMDEELGGRRWAVKGPLGPRTLTLSMTSG